MYYWVHGHKTDNVTKLWLYISEQPDSYKLIKYDYKHLITQYHTVVPNSTAL